MCTHLHVCGRTRWCNCIHACIAGDDVVEAAHKEYDGRRELAVMDMLKMKTSSPPLVGQVVDIHPSYAVAYVQAMKIQEGIG